MSVIGRITLLVLVSFSLTAFWCGELIAQQAENEDAFLPLFPDNSLAQWVRTNTPEETWRFQEGLLVCSGKPIGEIRTKKMYQNFILELEWRHMVPRGNAGVFVWADDITSRGVPFHRGIEVQVLENAYGNTNSYTTHGDIFPIHGATMNPINGRGGSRAFPTENRSNPSPEWNHYRIECIDGEISLAVNGKVVTRGKDCVPRKGYICLESEGGVVHYRNVRLRELPASQISGEHVAIADRGYRSIYSGLDLRGWNASDVGKWSSSDWILNYAGPSDSAGRLTSDERLESLGFVVDVRMKDASSHAVIEAGSGLSIDLSAETVRSFLEPDGRWNRIEAWTSSGVPIIEINGNRVPVEAKAQQRGTANSLELRPAGNVEFANLYIRSVED